MCSLIFNSVPQRAIYDFDGTKGGASKGRMAFLD